MLWIIAHAIDYTQFDNLVNAYLSPNMTSCLQPVYSSTGTSFKCAFRRLLVDHILQHVDRELSLYVAERRLFKINMAVTTCDAVLFMSKAWNMVPTSVVINGWISIGILAAFQIEELRDIRNANKKYMKAELRPQVGNPLETEKSTGQPTCD